MLSWSWAVWTFIREGESGVAHSEHAGIVFPSSSPAEGLFLFFSSHLLPFSPTVDLLFGVITWKMLRTFSRQRKLMSFYTELHHIPSSLVMFGPLQTKTIKSKQLWSISVTIAMIIPSLESMWCFFSNSRYSFWMWNLIFIVTWYKWWLRRFWLHHFVRSCSWIHKYHLSVFWKKIEINPKLCHHEINLRNLCTRAAVKGNTGWVVSPSGNLSLSLSPSPHPLLMQAVWWVFR